MNPVTMAAFAEELSLIHGLEKDAVSFGGIAKGIGKMFKPGKTVGRGAQGVATAGKGGTLRKVMNPTAPKPPGGMAMKGVPHGKGGWGVPKATPKSSTQAMRGQLKGVGGFGYSPA